MVPCTTITVPPQEAVQQISSLYIPSPLHEKQGAIRSIGVCERPLARHMVLLTGTQRICAPAYNKPPYIVSHLCQNVYLFLCSGCSKNIRLCAKTVIFASIDANRLFLMGQTGSVRSTMLFNIKEQDKNSLTNRLPVVQEDARLPNLCRSTGWTPPCGTCASAVV